MAMLLLLVMFLVILLILPSICSIVMMAYKLLYSKKEIIKCILIEKIQNKRIGE
ncbi:hypothetical protein HMPREF0833_11562 [Streptococcus parasanguinis ATCC 15912]|uniref:Uncharacterized protein n=1 Tax=Streptococcus parasanguinis (strain ATCC 15912 / DSM 6778 / CIP 104372 / LMG 14537) TaxID=760570 RepID=F8DGB4_STREP|nr:hypothetical protein HMPREF0833_11562 [Streptococcus parasanguinis ATCC 15912]